jgi:hypothetical protein
LTPPPIIGKTIAMIECGEPGSLLDDRRQMLDRVRLWKSSSGIPPGPALFRHFVEHVRDLAGSVYGRRTYEIMRIWDEDLPVWDAEERRAKGEATYRFRSEPAMLAWSGCPQPFPSRRDREFESVFLQRGVRCEPDFRGQIPSIALHKIPIPAFRRR